MSKSIQGLVYEELQKHTILLEALINLLTPVKQVKQVKSKKQSKGN